MDVFGYKNQINLVEVYFRIMDDTDALKQQIIELS